MRRLSTLWLAMAGLLAGMPPPLATPQQEISQGGAPQSIAPAKGAEKPASVSEILITPGPAGGVTIDVATTKSATFHTYRFDHPDRLVVDIEGMRNAVRRNPIPVSSQVVKEVRVGQFRAKNPEVVRVVADLSGNPLFDARAFAGGVRLEVKPRATAVSRAVAQPAASKKETAVSPAAPPAAASTPGTAAKREELKPDYKNSLLTSEGRSDVAAAPRETPQTATPEALRAETAAQVLSAGAASNPIGAPSTGPAGPAPHAADTPAYTGELISVNLKDVDLKDFFRLVHEISGLNILVDPNVTGSVTMVLDNVPWDQALDIVLKDNGLGKVLEGNVLRIARVDTLLAEQEAANKMAAERLAAAPLVTVFRPVNYATATDIANLLNTWSRGGRGGAGEGGQRGSAAGPLTERGTVLVDKRTNTLIISDVASQIPKIEETIDKLDTKTKQVAIEARIVLATSTFQRTLSAALMGAGRNSSGSTVGVGQTGTGSSLTPSASSTSTSTSSSSAATAILPPWTTWTAPANATSGFGVVAITNFSQRYLIDAVISAAEIRSQAKTISRPSIITQTNTEGMVQQGTQIPVQTNINNTISVQYVNATLQLTVTPQVTDDGHIFLKINVQNASPGNIVVNASVSINIQQATTQVLVPDGGTVVFGGVRVTQRQNSVTQIPLLGNIPILGNLFKSTNVQDTDQELLFFVSPRLLTTT
jgi:type IV pilus assembly protein PilQ